MVSSSTEEHPRRGAASLPDRLIEAAETLYGRHGIDGVSLRQIGKFAGSSNSNAVQYCFGNVTELIRALIVKRAPEVDSLRGRLLAQMQRNGALDTEALLEILHRPLLEHVNRQGERAFARFVLALSSSPRLLDYEDEMSSLMPISEALLKLIYAAMPELPPAFIRERIRLSSVLVLTSVFNRIEPYAGAEMDEALVASALAMASAAVTAPVPESTRRMLDSTQSAF